MKKTSFASWSGFALPTVLIASVVLLSILAVSVTATSSTRTALKTQYYAQLAQVAGEAGTAFAQACLAQSGNVPTWTNAKPLTPGTDCSGNPLLDPANVAVLVVAGGGGGGSRHGGGGGAGGVISNSTVSVTQIGYPVVVGFGGAGTASGAIPNQDTSTSGGNSSVFGLTAIGGGAGRGDQSGLAGGSGGGSGAGVSSVPGAGTSGQGNSGGTGVNGSPWIGGGGGGAGGVGQNGSAASNPEPAGGPGVASSITGSSVTYAAGGKGGNYSNQTVAVAGAANTGNGGGGAGGETNGGGAGGSGVVIISYPTGSGITATGGTVTTSGGNTVHRFTSSGSFTVTATPAAIQCPGDNNCFVSVNENVRSSFSIGLPTLDTDGKAVAIPQNGFVELTRTSTGVVWRTYAQPSTQALAVPALCSGAASSQLGWNNAQLSSTTAPTAFPVASAQVININTANSAIPGPVYYRKDFNVTERGDYLVQVRGDDQADVYVNGGLVMQQQFSNNTVSKTVTLEPGCHVIHVELENHNLFLNGANLTAAITKTGSSVPLVVTDRTWRVSAGDTVDFSSRDYFQSPQWAAVRDFGAVGAGTPYAAPSDWVSETNDSTARWITTTNNASGNNYPAARYTYFRQNLTTVYSPTTPTNFLLSIACDDSCRVFINGTVVLEGVGHTTTSTAIVSLSGSSGNRNRIGVELYNGGAAANPAGFVFSVRNVSTGSVVSRSDTNWVSAPDWYVTQSAPVSYNHFSRPNPDFSNCNCANQYVTNFATNPTFEDGVDAATPTFIPINAIASTPLAARSGTNGLRVTYTGTTGTIGVDVDVPEIVPGLRYRISGYVRASVGMVLAHRFRDAAGGVIADVGGFSTGQYNPNGSWYRFAYTTTDTSPVGVGMIRLSFRSFGTPPNGTVFDLDDVMVTASTTVYNYGDGSSTDWLWVGTQNGSISSGPN